MSNNNIPRFTKMLLSFRETYGVKMMDLPVRLLENDGEFSFGLEQVLSIVPSAAIEVKIREVTEKRTTFFRKNLPCLASNKVLRKTTKLLTFLLLMAMSQELLAKVQK